jgi:N utilization substance protein B
LVDSLELDGAALAFGRELATGTISQLFSINELLAKFLDHWTLDRVERVPLAILRLAAHELLHCPDVPATVVINEAIEIGKIYAGPESKRIINGVLDRIRIHLGKSAEKPSPAPG